jgi:hypothetical protein
MPHLVLHSNTTPFTIDPTKVEDVGVVLLTMATPQSLSAKCAIRLSIPL